MDIPPKKTVAAPDHAAVGQDANRLPWTAPVLGVYDAARLTLGTGEGSTDGLQNTKTS